MFKKSNSSERSKHEHRDQAEREAKRPWRAVREQRTLEGRGSAVAGLVLASCPALHVRVAKTTHRRSAAGGFGDISRVRLWEGRDDADRRGGEEKGGKHGEGMGCCTARARCRRLLHCIAG